MLPYNTQTTKKIIALHGGFLRGHHMATLQLSTPKALLSLALITATALQGGCRLMNKGNSSEAMAEELKVAPPVMVDALEERHMLVMQAPNPGWTIALDRDERVKDAWIVYISIKRPNPAFMYPQRIVDKRLLTEIETSQPLNIMARLLNHDQNGTKDQYAPLKPVDAFTP